MMGKELINAIQTHRRRRMLVSTRLIVLSSAAMAQDTLNSSANADKAESSTAVKTFDIATIKPTINESSSASDRRRSS